MEEDSVSDLADYLCLDIYCRMEAGFMSLKETRVDVVGRNVDPQMAAKFLTSVLEGKSNAVSVLAALELLQELYQLNSKVEALTGQPGLPHLDSMGVLFRASIDDLKAFLLSEKALSKVLAAIREDMRGQGSLARWFVNRAGVEN
jgi:hypothetical protein